MSSRCRWYSARAARSLTWSQLAEQLPDVLCLRDPVLP
jgi:hypothetical protein